MKKRFSLFIILVIAIALLSACNNSSSESNPDGSTSGTDETTESVRETFDIILKGESQIRIVRPANFSTKDPQVASAIKIRKAIADATGIEVDISDDFIKDGEKYDSESFEILVGNTQYPETAEAASQIKYGDYAIKVVGNKLIIFGYTDAAIEYSAERFTSLLGTYTSKDNGSVNLSIPLSELNVANTHGPSKQLSALPTYDGAAFEATYTSNTNCDQIIFKDSTKENYSAYIEKLQQSGFTKYTENEINNNLFATLYNSDYTINIGYYEYYSNCRLIIEPYSEKTLIGLESDNVYTPVTTSQITLIGLEFKESDGSYCENGLSMLYRLADGSFVIIDGGHTTQSSVWANNLINIIKEQAKDYASNDKDIRIAAWFVTHAHGDHMGMLNKQHTLFTRFNVERVVACFMSDEECDRSALNAKDDTWGEGEGSYSRNVRSAAANMGADFVIAHPGQRFYFADTVFEILYTVENYGPKIVYALNTASLLIRTITTDKSGNTTTAMLTGDLTGDGMDICNKIYGSNMRSNIVQVAHHGYTTNGNDNAMKNAYKYMLPEIVLWPQGRNDYIDCKERAYNKVLWDSSNPNHQKTYVAGWNNTQHIVPLPYNGDINTITSIMTYEP